MKLSEREQWFLDRVGKRVWRNTTSCTCGVCDASYIDGVIISDEIDALDSYYHECDFTSEGDGFPIKYFDTPEERDAFELTLKTK